MKEGYKTSEFWVSVMSLFAVSGFGVSPTLVDETHSWVIGMIAGAYTLGRSWLKQFGK